MYPIIFPLYGSLAINSYGFFIALGVIISIFFIKKDDQCVEQGIDTHIIQIIYVCFFGAFFGGKLLYYALKPELLVDWLDIIVPWRGGFSILGSVAGAISCLLLYLRQMKMNILKSLDCLAPYVPLLQSFGRIGCFFAGCCYGKNGHPVQLYSAILLFGVFLYLYKKKGEQRQDGSIFLQYIMLASVERFIIDYWRVEQVFGFGQQIVSHNQWLALLLFFLAALWYTFLFFCSKLKLNH